MYWARFEPKRPLQPVPDEHISSVEESEPRNAMYVWV